MKLRSRQAAGVGPSSDQTVRRAPSKTALPLRVAHLTTVDLSLEKLLRAQLDAVVEAGGEAIGISSPGPWVAGLEAGGVRHVALASSTRGMDLRADLRAMSELWRVLRRERPTVLHTHNPKPGVYGRILGRLARVPIVVNTVHGLYATADDPWVKRAIVYTLEAVASRFSDAELVQNPEDVDTIRRYHLASRRKVRLLGNGVDLTRFDRVRLGGEPRRRLRAEWGVADERVVIGIVGRLVAEKGYPELFEAMAGLPGADLVVVGPDDPDKPDALPRPLVEQAAAAGVRFLGHRDDVEHLYSAFDVFVLPSHREGFPRAAMEAAAMGLPIVATDIRGCRQVVEPGVNGLLVPVRDAAALREALAQLVEDAEGRAAMGKASAERARLHFDEHEVVRRVLACYADVAAVKGIALVPMPTVAGRSEVEER